MGFFSNITRSIGRRIKKTAKKVFKEAKKTFKDPERLVKGKSGLDVLTDVVGGQTGIRQAIGIGKGAAETATELIAGSGGDVLAPRGPSGDAPGVIDEEAERKKEAAAEDARLEKERRAGGSRTRNILTGGQGVEEDEDDDETSVTRRTLAGF